MKNKITKFKYKKIIFQLIEKNLFLNLINYKFF